MDSQLAANFDGQVLFQNKKWSIEVATIKIGLESKKQLVVVRDQTFTDWVTIYLDKRIAFDYPELIPTYIIDKVKRYAQTKTNSHAILI